MKFIKLNKKIKVLINPADESGNRQDNDNSYNFRDLTAEELTVYQHLKQFDFTDREIYLELFGDKKNQ